jgi:hypothetical protein
VQGRELWVMVVSASPYEHMIGKPNVKYVANMHGRQIRQIVFEIRIRIFISGETKVSYIHIHI